MSALFNQAIAALETVLEQENEALRTSQFGQLEQIKNDKLAAVARLDDFYQGLTLSADEKVAYQDRLSKLQGRVARNTGLLQAALYGARSAQDRINAIARQDRQVGAYDPSGRPLSFDTGEISRTLRV